MLRCFFQRCMVDSRMIIDAFRNVESRRRDGTTSDFQRRKRRAHTSLLSFFFFSLGRPVHYFLPQPRSRIGPMHLHKTEQVPTGPSGSDSPASMLLTCPSLPPLHGLISGRLSFFLETSRQECLCLEHDFQPGFLLPPSFPLLRFFFQVCRNFYDFNESYR